MHYEKFADGSVKCIEEEIPFELPEGWAWARLGNICPYGESNTVASAQINDDAWILDLEDIEKDTGKIIYFATKNERDSKSNKNSFKKGQLLYSKLRPYLNKVVIAPNNGYCTTEILPLELYGNISPYYIQIFLMSTTFLSYVNLISYGLKMPRLGTNDGKKALIAIPPIKEQCQIVEKSNYLISIVNDLQAEKNELLETVERIKRKILDLAIRGQLVPQNPDDEPASILLERIRTEKEELIKQGKIKRDKKESIIFKGEDNSYYALIDGISVDITEHMGFELPDGWRWITLREIATITSGKTPKSELLNTTGLVPYFKVADMNRLGNELYMQYADYYINNLYAGPVFESGSFVFPKNGGAVLTNKKRILTNNSVVDLNTGVFTPSKLLNQDYIFFLFSSIDFSKIYKGAVIPTVDSSVIGNLIYGLPPVEEQIRIADTIKKFFIQLEHIEMALS